MVIEHNACPPKIQVGVLNSKKNATEMFHTTNQPIIAKKQHGVETFKFLQSPMLQSLPNQFQSMTDSSASQIHQTF